MAIEALECRQYLTSIVVNSTADTLAPPNGTVTLRSAIASANASATPTTITFDSTVFAQNQTINLPNGVLELTNTAQPTSIVAPSVLVTLNAQNASRDFFVDPNVSLSLTNIYVFGGSAVVGGGIYTGANSTLNMTGGKILNCHAVGNSGTFGVGGAIDSNGTLTLTGVNISSNGASSATTNGGDLGSGGAICMKAGTATVTNCSISFNTATGDGAGIDAEAGGLTITGSSIIGNSCGFTGGGIAASASLTISNCLISSNTATIGNGGGVFIAFGSTATIDECNINGNASASGGGVSSNAVNPSITRCIFAHNTATSFVGGGFDSLARGATLTNDTFYSNSASSTTSGSGGALATNGSGNTVIVSDCTIYNNSAGFAGGGIANTAAAAQSVIGDSATANYIIANTIIAGNTAPTGPDASATSGISSSGHNFIGKTDGSAGWTNTDLTGTIASPIDPKLASPPTQNGGPTQTLLPQSGSPVINAGDNNIIPASTPTDERGFTRIVGPAVDIGAVETPTGASTSNIYNVTGFADGTGTVTGTGPYNASTLRAAINAANAANTNSIINLPAGTYTFAGSQLGTMQIFSKVDIEGAGASSTIIDASGLPVRPFTVVAVDGLVVTFNKLTIQNAADNNVDSGGGGAIEMASNNGTSTTAVLNLTNDVLTKNSESAPTGGFGGAIAVSSGTLNITNSTVSDNQVLDYYFAEGGGIYMAGSTVNILNSTLSGNSLSNAQTGQGAAIINQGGTLNISNSTIAGNFINLNSPNGQAASFSGAGIAVLGSGKVFLANDTIAYNKLTYTTSSTSNRTLGAGLYAEAGSSVNLQNTIVAKNTSQSAADDLIAVATSSSTSPITGVFTSHGYNLLGNGNASFTATTGDQVNADPLFSTTSVQNNGGPTQTLLPGNSSPAIDQGGNALAVSTDHSTALTTDQRGNARVNNATVDIGSVEVAGVATSAPTITTNPTNQSVSSGQTATFTAAASGNPTPTVQWQVSTNGGSTFTDIAGATSTTLSFTAATADNAKQYRAVFTNSQNTATTTAATLTVSAALTAPTVTTNPSNQSVSAGQTATFTAAASGNPTPTVQWQVSTNSGSTFTDIAGATSTTLSFTAANADNAKQYRAVFTNSQNTATTTAATLTVSAALTAPTVTTNPSNQSVTAGQTATFTAAASGNPTPSVQWQVSTNGGSTFTDIAGATSTTLSFTAAAADNAKQYRAVFTNSQNTATTTAATLTVSAALTAPTVTTNPSDQSVSSGQTATFTAAASGNPSPTVQWQVSTNGGSTFTDIPGATSTTLSFTAAAADNAKQYRAVFTNSQNTATTTAATLTVSPVTTSSLQIDAGGPAAGSFVADADFNGGRTYSTGAVIDTSAVSNSIPQAVWQTERYGNFTYTMPNLTPGATYTVKLDFDEIFWSSAGKRLFNVDINGQQDLANFDIFAAAGGMNKAISRSFSASADNTGKIVITFTTLLDNAKIDGIEVTSGGTTPTPTPTSTRINSGGGASGPFAADMDFAGGTSYSTGAAVSTAGLSGAIPPQPVLQTERYGNFSYTVPALTPGVKYSVRLVFDEIFWNTANQRLFNVSINGQQVINNFDIFTAAGGANKAIDRNFGAIADSQGRIVIIFSTLKDNAKVDAVAVVPAT